MTNDDFDSMLLAMGPFSESAQRIIDYAIGLRAQLAAAQLRIENALAPGTAVRYKYPVATSHYDTFVGIVIHCVMVWSIENTGHYAVYVKVRWIHPDGCPSESITQHGLNELEVIEERTQSA